MDTLGVVECKSIAAGVELADTMVKVADVELVRAATICAGRYLIFVSGKREDVETSVKSAVDAGKPLMGSFVISNISPQLVEALKKGTPAERGDAVAVIEASNVSSGINAADAAVKRSAVRLAKLVTGQGIIGKSYFVLLGDVASVSEAAEAACEALGKNLVESVVIPRPEVSVLTALTGGVR